MTESHKSSHWNSLATELGAEIRPEEPRPIPAAHVSPPVVPPRRRMEPVAPVERPASDWDVLASDLGLQPLPPRPKTPPAPRKPAIPAPPPAKPAAEKPPAFERKDIPERRLQVERPSAIEEPVAELEDRWPDEVDELDFIPEAAESDTTAVPAEETAPKTERKRRRRRRGGRKSFDAARDEAAPAEREPDLFAPPTDDETMPITAEAEAESGGDLDVDLSSAVAGAETEPSEREDRPRRRRRRRGGRKNGRAAAEKTLPEAFEEEEELGLGTEAEPAADEEEIVPIDSGAADLDAQDQEDLDEDDSSLDPRDLKSHRSIPSWSDAIGAIIAVNMEARAKNPGQGSGAPRGRGGWGRGRGRPPGGRR